MIDEARKQGRDEGYRAAMEQIEAAETTGRAAQLRRVADALVAAANDVHDARRDAVEMGASDAAELAYALAEAFLQRELSVGRPAVEAVSRAMHLIPDEQDIVVRLHPGDAIAADELRGIVPDAEVKVVEDPRVEPGGCVVVAGPCRIDTQIGSALERARQILAELYGAPAPDRVEVPA
jgi:flagellar biosynthesis/type III secretory pathway protein FliH